MVGCGSNLHSLDPWIESNRPVRFLAQGQLPCPSNYGELEVTVETNVDLLVEDIWRKARRRAGHFQQPQLRRLLICLGQGVFEGSFRAK
jgi:hypothetical protein